MPLRLKDQRTEQRSIATRLYSNRIKAKSEPPVDGWAKQRQQWGEVDHRARGAVSPLGGQVKWRR
jgi:hypothetical protein